MAGNESKILEGNDRIKKLLDKKELPLDMRKKLEKEVYGRDFIHEAARQQDLLRKLADQAKDERTTAYLSESQGKMSTFLHGIADAGYAAIENGKHNRGFDIIDNLRTVDDNVLLLRSELQQLAVEIKSLQEIERIKKIHTKVLEDAKKIDTAGTGKLKEKIDSHKRAVTEIKKVEAELKPFLRTPRATESFDALELKIFQSIQEENGKIQLLTLSSNPEEYETLMMDEVTKKINSRIQNPEIQQQQFRRISEMFQRNFERIMEQPKTQQGKKTMIDEMINGFINQLPFDKISVRKAGRSFECHYGSLRPHNEYENKKQVAEKTVDNYFVFAAHEHSQLVGFEEQDSVFQDGVLLINYVNSETGKARANAPKNYRVKISAERFEIIQPK